MLASEGTVRLLAVGFKGAVLSWKNLLVNWNHKNLWNREKWDLIHCVMNSDCVQVHGRRARDCLQDRTSTSDVMGNCQTLMTSLMDCRNSQLNARHRLQGKLTHESHAIPNLKMFGGIDEDK